MCLWPGQDGFDYPFQSDYGELWAREREGISEIARYAVGHRIGIEYKAREPRSHILLDSASSVLLFARWIGADNVGIHLDFGHALLAKENPAEAAAKAMCEGKLYGVHLNDNYGSSDEDMLPMSVHHLETMEIVHALRSSGYDGLDRMDNVALRASRSAHSVIGSLETVNAALLGC
jgi:xylose isomerase